MIAVRVILVIIAVFLALQILLRIVRKLFHFPAPAFMGRLLDSRWRRRVQPPQKVLDRSGVKAGMTVLELGCGSGAFTPFTARRVGEKGKVYALDIQPGMLEQLKEKLSRQENSDIRNVFPTLGSAYDLPFESGFFDLVYMVTVFQEIPDRRKALQEIRRVLKPRGVLAITELLPDPDYPFRATTIRQGTRAGLHLEGSEGNLWGYTVRFTNP